MTSCLPLPARGERVRRLAGVTVLLGALSAHAQEAYETTVSDDTHAVPEERASSTVRRGELDRRLPRSAPDALRYEPGVFIQQTAHAQASAYLRGLTGQQTLLMFDGIRLNTSTWRQGPNQYFFTLDAANLEAVEVLRGGGSTRFGSDALGGVIAATPIEAPGPADEPWLAPSVTTKFTSADSEKGGRVGVRGAVGPVGFVGGVGFRRVGLLESSGPVTSPVDGSVPAVPRFQGGRLQLGTGFDELTADGRVTWRPGHGHELTVASHAYRQYDAPRTDQCPPPFARADECLRYAEQFRTLTWLAWKVRTPVLQSLRVTASWQQQHELREGERPASFVRSTGRDVVDTIGASLVVEPVKRALGEAVTLGFRGGLDGYTDLVSSKAFLSFTDVAITRQLSRGQYLDGSTAFTGGTFLEAALHVRAFTVRTGGRFGLASVHAPDDAPSGTQGLTQLWLPAAAHAGLEWRPLSTLSVFVNGDRSFRAPNLDDLTSRQQTGPGFQFENAGLRPELATTLELGARVRLDWLTLDAWGFQTWLDGALVKEPRDVTQCPLAAPACQASWFRYQLVNADGVSEVRGLEGTARVRFPRGFGARATATYTWGEGPGFGPAAPRVPLSRVPPVNGHLELSWRAAWGLTTAAVLRWAGPQTRLAIADLSDARIPLGGTPGYAVVDLRASLRVEPLLVSLVLENLFDTPWRAHGSSVNGPGRGVLVLVSLRAP